MALPGKLPFPRGNRASQMGCVCHKPRRPRPDGHAPRLAELTERYGDLAVLHPVARGRVFRYGWYTVDAERGVLSCGYSLDGREITERVALAPGPRWHSEAARAAARLVFLLAGVSYYKTAAPPVIDLGPTALSEAELAFLREFYLQGLGEFAHRNHLDLTALTLDARRAPDEPSAPQTSLAPQTPPYPQSPLASLAHRGEPSPPYLRVLSSPP